MKNSEICETEAHFLFENSPLCVHFAPPDASGRVRTRPIWRVRLPKRCKGCAPQPPNRPVVVQRPTPCNFSTVCSRLGGFCGLCGAKAHTAGQLSPIFVDLGNLWTWGICGSCGGHAGANFSTAVRETGRRPGASGCDPIFCVRTRPDAPGRVRRPLWCEGTHRKSRPVVQRHTPRRTLRFCASGRVHLVRPAS